MTGNYLIIFVISFAVTLLATPAARKLAFMTGVVDRPGSLKVHRKPVAYLGGVAILLGLIGGLLMAGRYFDMGGAPLKGVIVISILVTDLGLLDDIIDIKQTYKFAAQIVLAVGVVYAGLRVNVFPFEYVAIPLTVFCVIGACNALNLLDGLDGLAGGVSAIAGVFFLILFLRINDGFGMALALALVGACLAFLIFNYNPASIFMGDAGSMLLGLILSILIIRYSSTPYDLRSFLMAIVICGVPIFDTALTYARRYINNRPIFPGDRSHFYDQLVDRGVPPKKTVLISYLIATTFGVAALLMSSFSGVAPFIIFLCVLSAVLFAVLRMKMLRIVK